MQVAPTTSYTQNPQVEMQGQYQQPMQGQPYPQQVPMQGQPYQQQPMQGQMYQQPMQGQPYPQQVPMQGQPYPQQVPVQGQPYQQQPGQPLMQAMAPRVDFTGMPNLLVKQTRKGWLQECLGCDANTEFNIATFENPQQNEFYATEDTSCCIRFFCGASRPFTVTVTQGNSAQGAVVSSHERKIRCLLSPCKLCCTQQVITFDKDKKEVGKVQEKFWCCIPTFNVYNATGDVKYKIHQPTCCGGCCVDCCAEGCCNCRIPFGIYEPDASGKSGSESGKIIKQWGGFSKEILTDADTFELVFPEKSDSEMRLNLLGGVFLINQLFFERSNGGANAVALG